MCVYVASYFKMKAIKQIIKQLCVDNNHFHDDFVISLNDIRFNSLT